MWNDASILRYVSPKFKSLSNSTNFLVQLKNNIYIRQYMQ